MGFSSYRRPGRFCAVAMDGAGSRLPAQSAHPTGGDLMPATEPAKEFQT
jgi:hypothetical protein